MTSKTFQPGEYLVCAEGKSWVYKALSANLAFKQWIKENNVSPSSLTAILEPKEWLQDLYTLAQHPKYRCAYALDVKNPRDGLYLLTKSIDLTDYTSYLENRQN